MGEKRRENIDLLWSNFHYTPNPHHIPRRLRPDALDFESMLWHLELESSWK